MTPTSKKVTRVTTGEYRSRMIGTKPRKIAVTIMAGDVLCLRLYGTQQREYISIHRVFEDARWSRVRSQMCQKLNAKKRSRSTASR